MKVSHIALLATLSGGGTPAASASQMTKAKVRLFSKAGYDGVNEEELVDFSVQSD